MKTFIHDLGGWSLITQKKVNYDWFHQLAKITRILGIHPILKIHVDLDYKDPTKFVIYVEPGDLIFPQYILTSSEYKAELEAYEKWIVESANHLSEASKRVNIESVKEIIKFEMYLATIRDNDNSKNERTTIQRLSQKFGVNFLKFLNSIFGSFSIISPNTTIIVKNYTFLKKLFLLIDKVGNKVVSDYLMWAVVKDLSRDTDYYMRKLNFLIDQAILGVQEDLTREYECLEKVIKYFSPLLVPRYLRQFVNPKIFPDVNKMVESIKVEFIKILKESEWLSKEGKLLTVQKIKNIKLHLGYPKWNFQRDSLKRYYSKVSFYFVVHHSIKNIYTKVQGTTKCTVYFVE